MPVESPMTPAPSKTAEPTDPETVSKRKIRATKPNSGIRIPPRPRYDWIPVNQPRIIRRDVNHIRAGGLNGNRRALRGYGLLRRGLKIAGLFSPLAHHLHGIHHILLLIVVSVAKR